LAISALKRTGLKALVAEIGRMLGEREGEESRQGAE
jgi:hypothetical protein